MDNAHEDIEGCARVLMATIGGPVADQRAPHQTVTGARTDWGRDARASRSARDTVPGRRNVTAMPRNRGSQVERGARGDTRARAVVATALSKKPRTRTCPIVATAVRWTRGAARSGRRMGVTIGVGPTQRPLSLARHGGIA